MAIALDGLSHKLEAFLADQSFRCDATGPGTAQIVMFRACRQNKDGSLSVFGDPLKYSGRYDDLLVVFGQKQSGARYLACYEASAKPGLEWIRHSSYRGSNRGCPTVQPGQYKYVRGMHGAHEALRQAYKAPVCVIRDLDQDAKLELSDLVDYPWSTGINIHAGGTSDWIGYNSSGCQVIRGGWGGAAWKGFHRIVYTVTREQNVFHYTVVDFAEFGRWHDAQDKTAHRFLRFGSYGKHVTALQAFLSRAGYYGAAMCDGEFGRVTDEGVRMWQKATGQSPTGIVELLS